MPEPNLAPTRMRAVVGNILETSKYIYQFIGSVEDAPKHALGVSQDTHDLYEILESLHILLPEVYSTDTPHIAGSVYHLLQKPLLHCLKMFREMQTKIHQYSESSGAMEDSGLAALRLHFTNNQTANYRSSLYCYKVVAEVALATEHVVSAIQQVQATCQIAQQVRATSSGGLVASQRKSAIQDLESLTLTMRSRLEKLCTLSSDGFRIGLKTRDLALALCRFLESNLSISQADSSVVATHLIDSQKYSLDSSTGVWVHQQGSCTVSLTRETTDIADHCWKDHVISTTRVYRERNKPVTSNKTHLSSRASSHEPPGAQPDVPWMGKLSGSVRRLRHFDRSPVGKPLISFAHALYSHQAVSPDDVSFKKGDLLVVFSHQNEDWIGEVIQGEDSKTGLPFLNYATSMSATPRTANIRSHVVSNDETDRLLLKLALADFAQTPAEELNISLSDQDLEEDYVNFEEHEMDELSIDDVSFLRFGDEHELNRWDNMSKYVRYPTLLSRAGAKNNPGVVGQEMDEEIIDSGSHRVNYWLLQQLRTSPLEVKRLENYYKIEATTAGASDRWETQVLSFWFKDGTTRPLYERSLYETVDSPSQI